MQRINMRELFFIFLFASSAFAGPLHLSDVAFLSNSSGSIFSPLSLSGLIAWYRAGVGITEVSGAVSQWSDQSGHAYNATQSNANFKPSYTASDSDFNNLASLTFDGSNDSLRVNGLAAFLDSPDAPWTILIVQKVNQSGIGAYACAFGVSESAGDGQAYVFARHASVDKWMMGKRSSAGNDELNVEVGSVDSSHNIVRWQTSGTQVEVFVNGSSVGTGSCDLVGGMNGIYGSIGGFPNYNDQNQADYVPYKGKISEMIIYNRLVTPSEGSALDAYLNQKFNIY